MANMNIRRILAGALLLAAGPALAQDQTLFDYLKTHTSIVSGVARANGESAEYVSVSLDDEFSLSPKLTGFGNLSLFGRQRVAGESVPNPEVPITLEGLALYSAGEMTAGAFYAVHQKIAIECRGGVSFKMAALTGQIGEPVDPSKFTAGCGPRFTGGPGRLSVIFGHYGPVSEGERLWGFIPTTIFDGEFRLPSNMSFLIRVAAGRDLATQKSVTSSWFSVRKGL